MRAARTQRPEPQSAQRAASRLLEFQERAEQRVLQDRLVLKVRRDRLVRLVLRARRVRLDPEVQRGRLGQRARLERRDLRDQRALLAITHIHSRLLVLRSPLSEALSMCSSCKTDG